MTANTYTFDVYRIDVAKRLVFGPDDEVVPLMPKAYEILLYLVTNNGRVVEKDELMSAVWPDTAVEENNLTQNISAIRRQLGEKHRENRFIATVPGRGYKFVAPVTAIDTGPGPSDSADGQTQVVIDEAIDESEKGPVQRPIPGSVIRWPIAVTAMIILAALGTGVYLWTRSGGDPGNAKITSLAVLPFKPLVEANRDEAVEMGIADTLIGKLSGNELIVRPLASVRRFASVDQDAVEAGRQLAVDAVLDGGILIVGDRIRVSAELVRVSDGKRLWNEQFDQRLTDIFAVQDSISQRVATALQLPLGEHSRKLNTASVEAYQYYMKASLHSRRLIRPEVEKGITYYEQAIALDPQYALAFVGLANAYRSMVLTNDAPPHEMLPKAYAAATRAVQIDPDLAEAWAALANDEFWYRWDWQAAEHDFRRALELDPRSPATHALYAHLMSNLGRHDEALNEIRRALEMDPPNPLFSAMEGQILCLAGRQTESTEKLKAAIELDPGFWLAHLFLSRNYTVDGNWDAAIASATKARDITGGNAEATATIGFALGKAGRSEEAREVLRELESRAQTRYVPQYAIAQVYLGLSEKQKALDALERAYEQHDTLMVFLNVEPKWTELRSEPRFTDLVRRMNFTK